MGSQGDVEASPILIDYTWIVDDIPETAEINCCNSYCFTHIMVCTIAVHGYFRIVLKWGRGGGGGWGSSSTNSNWGGSPMLLMAVKANS